MRVETLGTDAGDDPEVAAVGAIHGDEPCGARALERFLSDGPTDRIRRTRGRRERRRRLIAPAIGGEHTVAIRSPFGIRLAV